MSSWQIGVLAAVVSAVAGILVAVSDSTSVAVVMVAAAGLILLPGEALGGLLLVGAWPTTYLGAGRAGLANAVLGIAALVTVIGPRRQQLAERLGNRSRSIVVLPILLLAMTLLASWPLTAVSIRRIAVFVSISLPTFLLGCVAERRRNAVWGALFALPLAVLLVIGQAPPHLNEIAAGHALVFAIFAVLTASRWRRLPRAVFVVACVVALSRTDALGPFVSLGVAGLVAWHWRRTRSASPRVRRLRAWKLLLTFSVLVAVVATALNRLSELNPTGGINTVLARWEAMKFITQNWAPLGHGADALDVSEFGDRYVLGYAHNYVLDAFYSAGLIGAAVMLILTGLAFRNVVRRQSSDSAMFIGIIVGALFSAGVYENWLLWFALGSLIYRTSADASASRKGLASSRSYVPSLPSRHV